MTRKPQPRLALLVVIPAILVPLLLPALRARHTPDFAMGAVVGTLIGLSIVALMFAIRRNRYRV